MKQLLLITMLAVLCGCHTPDYTKGESSTCEVHHVAMIRRTVPIAYGMIPMSKVEAGQGEWKRRTEQYPHPGDCLPATSINMHGVEKAQVYVCSQCERLQKTLAQR